jgi:hypothetical protein
MNGDLMTTFANKTYETQTIASDQFGSEPAGSLGVEGGPEPDRCANTSHCSPLSEWLQKV